MDCNRISIVMPEVVDSKEDTYIHTYYKWQLATKLNKFT